MLVKSGVEKGDDALYGYIAGDQGPPLDLENRRTLFDLQQGCDIGRRGGGPDHWYARSTFCPVNSSNSSASETTD